MYIICMQITDVMTKQPLQLCELYPSSYLVLIEISLIFTDPKLHFNRALPSSKTWRSWYSLPVTLHMGLGYKIVLTAEPLTQARDCTSPLLLESPTAAETEDNVSGGTEPTEGSRFIEEEARWKAVTTAYKRTEVEGMEGEGGGGDSTGLIYHRAQQATSGVVGGAAQAPAGRGWKTRKSVATVAARTGERPHQGAERDDCSMKF